MDSQLVSSPASPVNEQHNFMGGIEGTLSPQFRTSPEKMIVPMSNPPKAVKGHYLTIHSSADNDDNQYIEGIWETVSPKFRTPPENNDKYLILNRPVDDLENHVSERAIVFRFGIYLQYLMSKESDLENYDLDCEYYRALYSIKRLPSFENGVYPDLIIHKRGEMEHNLLVMEIKTWWNSNTDQDCKKLREFVSEKGLFKYKYGLSILVNKDSYKLNWVLPSGDEN